MSALGSLLALPHAWLATAGAVVATVLAVLGALDGAGVVRARRSLDRLAVVLFALLLGSLLLGPAIAIGVGGPADPQHFLFAAVAMLAVPAFRWIAARRGPARVGWWMAAGAVVTLAALLRLWATGG
jgi:hypothetical protein